MIQTIKKDFCIIGFGPASIGAALELSNSSIIKDTIVIEAGKNIDEKNCPILKNEKCLKEKTCSIISGFGGSSVLGGSKLSDYPAGSNIAEILESDKKTRDKFQKSLKIIKKFVKITKHTMNSPAIELSKKEYREKGFEYKYYDVYKFDKKSLITGYKKIELLLIQKGLLFYHNTTVKKIKLDEGKYTIFAEGDRGPLIIQSKYVIVGVGRLGYDLLESINTEFNLNAKENPLDIGVRLEFPTEIFPNIDGTHGDLKLLFADNARTFCVCKGGKIAPYLLDDIFCTEGYLDLTKPTPFTNVAILIRVQNMNYSYLIDYVKKQLITQTNRLPIRQKYDDYIHSIKSHNTLMDSSINHWAWGEINQLFPEAISQKINNALKFFVSNLFQNRDICKITIFAPEIHRNGYNFILKQNFSIKERIYLIGECSGAFRGILQSFTSGVICAESILEEARK
jgi:hypothetical protein